MKQHLTTCLILMIATVTTAVTSCKKKNNTASTGTFYMHLHTNIDSNEVDSKTTLYRDSSGRHFSLSTAQFYITNIRLHNVNGATYTFIGTVLLKSIDSEQYIVGTAPVGTYDNVTFDVGLDAATNAMNPASFTTNGYVSNSTMWYGNTAQGYAAVFIEGTADTSATQNGTGIVPIWYKIASTSYLKTVTMPTRGTGTYATYTPYVLTASGAQYIHMICDYGIMLSAVDFKTIDSSDSYNIKPWKASLIANNIANSFRYED